MLLLCIGRNAHATFVYGWTDDEEGLLFYI
jgi:hypothetical protein